MTRFRAAVERFRAVLINCPPRRPGAKDVLRSVAKAQTEVDGQQVSKGEEAAVRQGTQVRVGGVPTLVFLGEQPAEEADQSTILRG